MSAITSLLPNPSYKEACISGFFAPHRFSFPQEQDHFPAEFATQKSEGFGLATRSLLVVAAFLIPFAVAAVVNWLG